MDSKQFLQLVDDNLQDFMKYVDSNYKLHDPTPVTSSDLWEYSNQIVGVLGGITKHIADFVNNQ